MDGAAGIVESTEVDTAFDERFLAARVTEEESRRFARQPPRVIAFTLMMIQARMGGQSPGQPGPNTSPATIPPYQKPSSRLKGRKTRKRGGHPGRSRKRPVRPDRTRTHRLNRCPECGEKLRRTRET